MVSGTASGFQAAAAHERELNERQRQILRLIEAGHTNREIADLLGMSVDGAKWNVSEILSKLGLASREEAAEYWRWRHAGVWSRVRGLMAAPLVKVAAGTTGAMAVVAIGVAILLPSGDDAPQDVRLTPNQPFVLEAVVKKFDRSRRADAPPDQASAHQVVEDEHEVTWSHRDSAHTRWDTVQTKSFDGRWESTSFVADGQREWTIHPGTAEYRPVEPGAQRAVFTLTTFGPTYQPDIPSLMASLLPRGQLHVEIVGHEVVLGRETVIIEYGAEMTYSWNGHEYLTGLMRMWVDPETMMILRHDVDSGRFLAEVTSLEYAATLDDQVFAYTPPADYSVVENPLSPTPVPTPLVKAVIRDAAGLPDGFSLKEESTESLNGEVVYSDRYYGTDAYPTGPWIRIRQRIWTGGGVPFSLRAGLNSPGADTDWWKENNGLPAAGWFADGVAFALTASADAREGWEAVLESISGTRISQRP
ncbi:MAG: LuxR C-terminal-related transcriptional regulator [Tepidiformaceae bacterium]